MDEVKISIFKLPFIFLLKVLKNLESQDVLSLSQTCNYFFSIIEQNYFINLIFPLDHDYLHNSPTIRKKKVLQIDLNIIGGGTFDNLIWKKVEFDTLQLNTIVNQIENFNTRETVNMCIKVDCSKMSVPQQDPTNYKNLVNIIKEMTHLKKCKIELTASFNDPRMTFIHYIHVSDLLQFCRAKQVILEFPEMALTNFSLPLKLSYDAEKVTIVGPCKGLFNMFNYLMCVRLKELIVTPLSEHCTLSDNSIHRNGICVINVKLILKHNPNIQYFNNIFVGDLFMMQECCQISILAERFFESYRRNGGDLSKHIWLNTWNSYKSVKL